MSDREALAIPTFDDDLDDFAPRVAVPTPQQNGAGQGTLSPELTAAVNSRATDTRRAIDAVSRFPSREASADGQLNLKGPRHVLDRFRAMCKADRRAYYDMLEILMDRYEDNS